MFKVFRERLTFVAAGWQQGGADNFRILELKGTLAFLYVDFLKTLLSEF